MINGRSILSAGSALFLCVALVACGGGDNSSVFVTGSTGGSTVSESEADDNLSPPSEPENVTFEELMATGAEADAFGNVIDSPVSGLRYKSGAHYGITDSDGKYGYIQGETVAFFIGDILIGHAMTPSPRLTPYELANSDAQVAMNIARFLQTLDNDADPENGIHINSAVHALAEDTTLDFTSSAWQGMPPPDLEPVEGEQAAKTAALELLVLDLTSATEAGARDLISAGSAMLHLSFTLVQVIAALGEQAESVLNASTCETDSQCKWTQLSNIPSRCSMSERKLVYSDANADLPAFASLEAQRDYLIDIREKLTLSVWGPDLSRGVCNIQVNPIWVICGESKHCEITTSSPIN
jgi:hypothetical protein